MKLTCKKHPSKPDEKCFACAIVAVENKNNKPTLAEERAEEQYYETGKMPGETK